MPLILGTNSIKDTGYNIANSCRFNDDDAAYMHKTPGSAGNRRTFTYSGWLKRSNLVTASTYNHRFFGVNDGASNEGFQFYTHPNAAALHINAGGGGGERITNAQFRDTNAWYHVVVACDTTESTANDRIKLYVNGVQITSFATIVNPDQNEEGGINNDVEHTVGRQAATSRYYDGYMAEVCFIDGLALTPTSFGEFDEDSPTIWKPKDVSGLTFGTNGFYLDFEDSGNLGNDANGGTDLTEVNLAATDQATDTPTNSFSTLNLLATTDSIGNDITFSEGNCKITNTSDGGWHPAVGNIGATSGKWYCEFKVATIGGASKYGIIDVDQYIERVNFADSTRAYSYEYNSGDAYNGGNYDSDYGDSFTTNDIISVAMDLDNMKLYFAKNGTWQDSGDPESGSTGTGTHAYFGGGSATQRAAGVDTYAFAANIHNNSVTEANFGNPSFTISSGNADANGYGNFEYGVPSGYLALCTKNLGSDGG